MSDFLICVSDNRPKEIESKSEEGFAKTAGAWVSTYDRKFF